MPSQENWVNFELPLNSLVSFIHTAFTDRKLMVQVERSWMDGQSNMRRPSCLRLEMHQSIKADLLYDGEDQLIITFQSEEWPFRSADGQMVSDCNICRWS